MTDENEDVTLQARVAELMRRIRDRNDQVALGELQRLLHDRLVGYGCRRLNNREDAEEIFTEVFIRVWNSRATCTRVEGAKSWIFSIATNLCLDRLRSRKRQQEHTGGEALPIDEVVEQGATSPEIEGLFGQSLIDCVMSCLRRPGTGRELTSAEVDVLKLLLDGHKYPTIARILGKSQDTTKSMLARTIRPALQQALALCNKIKE